MLPMDIVDKTILSCADIMAAIRLLISHNQMGTIIGRQGLKIKHIQDVSGVRMVAQKEMLPQSTERIVEVQGTPEGIQKATWEIGKCLVDDWQRGTGTVLYNPAAGTLPNFQPCLIRAHPSNLSSVASHSKHVGQFLKSFCKFASVSQYLHAQFWPSAKGKEHVGAFSATGHSHGRRALTMSG